MATIDQRFICDLNPKSYRRKSTSKRENSIIEYINYHQYSHDNSGIGFVLTNGIIGYYYLDKTSMIWLEAKNTYKYIGCRKKAIYFNKEYKCINTSIEEKIKLLCSFMEHYSKLCEENKLIKMRSAKFIKSEKEISVSRVFKIKEGILFKFTNGSVQMIFVDKVKVIIDFNEKLVLHINPKGGKEFGRMKTSYSITTALEGSRWLFRNLRGHRCLDSQSV